MDRICVDELKIFAHHGVFEHENINGQNFYVNAVLYVDTEKAASLDMLEYSVDYGSVCKLIGNVLTEKKYKLIEAAAQAVTDAVLREFPLVEKINLELRKPEAPIDMDFGSVSVKISRGWHTALIALGSNIGDSRQYIENAVSQLSSDKRIRDVRVSELITTKPYGYTEQDDFLNGALLCRTTCSPHTLLDLLHDVENSARRTREIHWGPRTLDLDLIFYDNDIISEPDLIVPHPDMQNRSFVLIPAAELIPYYRHPLLGLTISQLLERLNSK